MDKTIILEDYEVYYTVYDKKDKSFIPEEIATTKRVDGGKYALIKREGYISITIPNSLARFLPKK